jgi:hypothetical protein
VNARIADFVRILLAIVAGHQFNSSRWKCDSMGMASVDAVQELMNEQEAIRESNRALFAKKSGARVTPVPAIRRSRPLSDLVG